MGSGAGDRGGLQLLNELIKTSCIPVFCICNDVRPITPETIIHFDNYSFFGRADTRQEDDYAEEHMLGCAIPQAIEGDASAKADDSLREGGSQGAGRAGTRRKVDAGWARPLRLSMFVPFWFGGCLFDRRTVGLCGCGWTLTSCGGQVLGNLCEACAPTCVWTFV